MIHDKVCGIALVWDKPKPSVNSIWASSHGIGESTLTLLLPRIECIKVDYVFCIDIYEHHYFIPRA